MSKRVYRVFARLLELSSKTPIHIRHQRSIRAAFVNVFVRPERDAFPIACVLHSASYRSYLRRRGFIFRTIARHLEPKANFYTREGDVLARASRVHPIKATLLLRISCQSTGSKCNIVFTSASTFYISVVLLAIYSLHKS